MFDSGYTWSFLDAGRLMSMQRSSVCVAKPLSRSPMRKDGSLDKPLQETGRIYLRKELLMPL